MTARHNYILLYLAALLFFFFPSLNFSIGASRPRRRRIFEASGGDTARGLRGREGHGYVSPPPHEREAGRPQDPRGTSVMQEATRKKASTLVARALACCRLRLGRVIFSHLAMTTVVFCVVPHFLASKVQLKSRNVCCVYICPPHIPDSAWPGPFHGQQRPAFRMGHAQRLSERCAPNWAPHVCRTPPP